MNLQAEIPTSVVPDEFSTDFRVVVNGVEKAVHNARVSAVPYNSVWPGYQRELNQTEIASFVTLDFEGQADVTIEVLTKTIESVEIRPREFQLEHHISGNLITLRLTQPRHFTVEVNGIHHALHVFSNYPGSPASYGVDIHNENTLYFGPGVHKADLIYPQSDQTIYIDEGAVVYGTIFAYKCRNLRVLGRGILDASIYKRGLEAVAGEPGGEIRAGLEQRHITDENIEVAGVFTAYECRDLVIDGVIFRDPQHWCVTTRNNCENVTMHNIKLIGLWRYNADGIDICTTTNALVTNCFIRSFDDCVVARGRTLLDERDEFRHMIVSDCVLWCDWGIALEVWTGRKEAHIEDVVFKDCHVIRPCHTVMDIGSWLGSPNTGVENITFENITVDTDRVIVQPKILQHVDTSEEYPVGHNPELFKIYVAESIDPAWKKASKREFIDRAEEPSHVRVTGVRVRNVTYRGVKLPAFQIDYDKDSLEINDITLQNINYELI